MVQNTYKNFKLVFLKSSYLVLIPFCNSALHLVYAISTRCNMHHFHPEISSPESKEVFCILANSGGPPVLSNWTWSCWVCSENAPKKCLQNLWFCVRKYHSSSRVLRSYVMHIATLSRHFIITKWQKLLSNQQWHLQSCLTSYLVKKSLELLTCVLSNGKHPVWSPHSTSDPYMEVKVEESVFHLQRFQEMMTATKWDDWNAWLGRSGQTRLATDRQCTHERRAAEQPEARQARLERLARELKMLGFAQWNAPASLL